MLIRIEQYFTNELTVFVINLSTETIERKEFAIPLEEAELSSLVALCSGDEVERVEILGNTKYNLTIQKLLSEKGVGVKWL